jgi:hypothetical protein
MSFDTLIQQYMDIGVNEKLQYPLNLYLQGSASCERGCRVLQMDKIHIGGLRIMIGAERIA